MSRMGIICCFRYLFEALAIAFAYETPSPDREAGHLQKPDEAFSSKHPTDYPELLTTYSLEKQQHDSERGLEKRMKRDVSY